MFRSQKINLIIAMMTCLSMTSCATVINGKTQKVPVTSYPSGAAVFVDGEMRGYTPTSVTLDRSEAHVISLAKDGYYQENIPVTPSMSGMVSTNIAPGILVGAGVFTAGLFYMQLFNPAVLIGSAVAGTLAAVCVDSSTGGAYKLSPQQVTVPLEAARY